MNQTNHCQLCELQQYDIHTGTRCDLTNDRPDFKDKCPDIVFKDKYQAKIKEINIEYELVKRTKATSISNFIVFLILSIATIAAGFLIGKYGLDKGVISTVPLIIMGVGVSILPLASGPLNTYRWGMKIARKKKKELGALIDVQHTIYY